MNEPGYKGARGRGSSFAIGAAWVVAAMIALPMLLMLTKRDAPPPVTSGIEHAPDLLEPYMRGYWGPDEDQPWQTPSLGTASPVGGARPDDPKDPKAG